MGKEYKKERILEGLRKKTDVVRPAVELRKGRVIRIEKKKESTQESGLGTPKGKRSGRWKGSS